LVRCAERHAEELRKAYQLKLDEFKEARTVASVHIQKKLGISRLAQGFTDTLQKGTLIN